MSDTCRLFPPVWRTLAFLPVTLSTATRSSILAQKIPWAEEPGGLQSMGSLRVGHDCTFTFHFYALENEMVTLSSVLAWRIPGTGEPDGPPSLGSHRVGHDWSDLAAAAEKKKISLVCFLLPLKRDKNVWHLQAISSVWRPLAFLPVTLSIGRKEK